MKKVLLFVISILSFSLLPIINNTYAQETNNQYPNYIMLASYNYFYEPIEYTSVYEFVVDYTIDNICINQINQNDYFLIDVNGIGFKKGIDRRTNSYQISTIRCSYEPYTRTWIEVSITVLKTYAYDKYNYPDNEENIELLFTRDTALYILYQSDTGSIDYDSGFKAGYDYGYDIGYDFGYDDGYTVGLRASQSEAYEKGRQVGFEEGQKSTLTRFIDNFHVWFIPAVIIVFAIGIFVSYKKGRDE